MGDCETALSTQCNGNPLPALSDGPGRANMLPQLSVPAATADPAQKKSYQFFKVRIRCATARFLALRERLLAKRASRKSWTQAEWEREVKQIVTEGWGVERHGGARRGQVAEASGKHPTKPATKASGMPASGGNKISLRMRKKMSPEQYETKCAQYKLRPVRALPASAPPASVVAAAAGHSLTASAVSCLSAPASGGNCRDLAVQPASGGKCHGLEAQAVLAPSASPALQPGVDLGYRILGPALGAGTFGEAFPAIWKNGATEAGGQLVVIKHVPIKRPHESTSGREAREVQLLRQLKHENVVCLLHAVQTPFALDLVFEHCDLDLRMAWKRSLDVGDGVSIMKQICAGLGHVHEHKIVHRDLKPANILVKGMQGHGYIIKIADFGCGRPLAASSESLDKPAMTKKVTTLWYRAPEVLLGTARYGLAIDIWSLGCVAVEVLTQNIAFSGTSEFDMLLRIFRICGSPSKTRWAPLTRLPSFSSSRFPPSQGTFPNWPLNDDERRFVQDVLIPCPVQRKTAKDILGHVYLKPASGGSDAQASGGSDAPASGGSDAHRPLAPGSGNTRSEK